MKLAILLLSLASVASAEPVCRNVWDAMNGHFVFVCTDPSSPSTNPPTCRDVYDPMTGNWVLVCDGVVQH